MSYSMDLLESGLTSVGTVVCIGTFMGAVALCLYASSRSDLKKFRRAIERSDLGSAGYRFRLLEVTGHHRDRLPELRRELASLERKLGRKVCPACHGKRRAGFLMLRCGHCQGQGDVAG